MMGQKVLKTVVIKANDVVQLFIFCQMYYQKFKIDIGLKSIEYPKYIVCNNIMLQLKLENLEKTSHHIILCLNVIVNIYMLTQNLYLFPHYSRA